MCRDRAASSIYQFMMCKRLIEHETLPPMLIRNVIPLCMAQYEKLFSTTRFCSVSHLVAILLTYNRPLMMSCWQIVFHTAVARRVNSVDLAPHVCSTDIKSSDIFVHSVLFACLHLSSNLALGVGLLFGIYYLQYI